MEISKLMEKTRKRLDITKYSGQKKIIKIPEFVTVLLYPVEVRGEIQLSKTEGLDVEFMKNFIIEKGLVEDAKKGNLDYIKLLTDNPEIVSKYILPNYDPLRMNYKMKVLTNGLDQDNHSFTTNGQPAKLTKEIFQGIYDNNRPLFDYLIDSIEKYQDEYSLGGR